MIEVGIVFVRRGAGEIEVSDDEPVRVAGGRQGTKVRKESICVLIIQEGVNVGDGKVLSGGGRGERDGKGVGSLGRGARRNDYGVPGNEDAP